MTNILIGPAAGWPAQPDKPTYGRLDGGSPLNSRPSGSINVTGNNADGSTLTAVSSLADPDTLGTITYQWEHSSRGNVGTNSATYLLVTADVAGQVRVNWSYTDGLGQAESGSSNWTSTIVATGGVVENVVTGLIDSGFETPDWLDTNVDGFSWYQRTSVSIVTRNPTCGGYGPGDDVIVVNPSGTSICTNIATNDRLWTAKTGDYSGRFRYVGVADGPSSNDNLSELRFDLGAYYPDLWIAFWLKVPINYLPRQSAYHSSNSKFFAIYQDYYEESGAAPADAVGSTCVWENNPDGVGGVDFITRHRNSITDPDLNTGHQNSYPDFMNSGDAGNWMRVVLRVKLESSPGAADGKMQSWRRWDGDSVFTQIHNWENQDMPISLDAGVTGFKRGYILGASNSGYADDTEFLIDDVLFVDGSSESLITGAG